MDKTGIVFKIKKVQNPILLNLKKDKYKGKKSNWLDFQIFAFIRKTNDLEDRSILKQLKDTISNLPSYENFFCGKIVLYFKAKIVTLNHMIEKEIVETELEINNTNGFFGPIAGELRYYTSDINSIELIISEWDQADYFMLINIDTDKIQLAKDVLRSDAFSYNESALYELSKVSNYIIRKSGDEDEFELITNKSDVINHVISLNKSQK